MHIVLFYSPVNIVREESADKRVKECMAFHAIVVHNIVVISDLSNTVILAVSVGVILPRFNELIYAEVSYIMVLLYEIRLMPPPKLITPIVPNSLHHSSSLFQT